METTWTHLMARPLIRPLLGTRVRPNHLTTLRLLTGIAACIVFIPGTRAAMWWGGGLWLVSAFLDRADGELARIGNMTSPGGHRYDYYSDTGVNTLLFVCIGFGLRHSWLGSWAITLGLISGISMLLVSLFSEWLLLRSPVGEKPYSRRWGFDPDDGLYLVGPLAWLGWLSGVLVGAAVGTTLMMIITAIRLLRARQTDAHAADPTESTRFREPAR
jgi:phosphatidylglycerophosphate synthase